MKRAVGSAIVLGLIGGAVWIGWASAQAEGAIALTFTLQRCPERGPCSIESFEAPDHVAALSVDGATRECDDPGDCTFAPDELEQGLAPGAWQIGAPPLPGLQRPESPYVQVRAGEVLRVRLQYRSAPETRLVETLDTLPPFGGPAANVDSSLHAAVQRYRRAHPDVFAGVFVAQGYLYVGFTERPRTHLTALHGSVSTRIRAFKADHSYRELRGIQDRISDDFDLLDAQGIFVSGVGVDVTMNRVSVSLETLTPEAEQVMAERYGSDKLAFEEGSYELLSR